MVLNRKLATALVLTLALTAAALWQPRQQGGTGSSDAVVPTGGLGPGNTGEPTGSSSERLIQRREPLPTSWALHLLEPASRDPFTPVSTAPSVTAIAPAPATPVVLAPPAPAPLSMPYRYLGSFVSPAGQRMVYLVGSGEQAIAVSPKDVLESGWTVDSIDAEGVHLYAPTTQQRITVAIPDEAP